MTWSKKAREKAIKLILEGISSGKSCRSILDKADRKIYPSFVTFSVWLKEEADLAKQYAHACEARADKIFEEILNISDCEDKDMYTDEDGNERVNHDVIQRDRLRVDARKWMLSKMQPKKYGDKLDLTSDNEKITNSVTIFQLPDNGRGG